MVVTLPIATIKRILDRVTNLPEPAGGLFVPGIFIPTPTTRPGPRLPENIVSALEKARDDNSMLDGGKPVRHLRRDDFTTLYALYQALRLALAQMGPSPGERLEGVNHKTQGPSLSLIPVDENRLPPREAGPR